MPRGALSNSHRKRSLELITGYKAVQAFKLVADKIKQNLLKHVLEQKMWAADVRSRHNKRIALLQDGARGVCARGPRPSRRSRWHQLPRPGPGSANLEIRKRDTETALKKKNSISILWFDIFLPSAFVANDSRKPVLICPQSPSLFT